MIMAKKIKFELMFHCTTGWDDDESVSLLEVYFFSDLLEAANLFNKDRRSYTDEESKLYDEYRGRLDTENGEELSYLGEAIGIRCFYEDEKGIRVQMSMNDEEDISGYATIDSQKHHDEYKKLLGEAKQLASDIMRL